MKHYEYEIDENLKGIVFETLRQKKDILRLLAYTVKSIVEQELCKDIETTIIRDDFKVVIHVSKMNRLFYCLKDKIFSFQMPFTITTTEMETVKIYFKSDLIIDSYLSSMLITVFEEENLFSGTIEDIYCRISEIIHNNYEVDASVEDRVWELFSYLMLYEPGYIRYEDDPKPDRMNPIMHPRYHLDINYETAATYKIGLLNRINYDRLRRLTDNTEKCDFIK